ncbi:MAG: GNAT family acetyltransferase [Parasphingorhabdus sp.]|uniref:GNAT family acetyltransferase n=1 Tax=Parasphingorhabdus sp. TaxID=2709688 RepID=UPI003298F77B
MADPFSIRTATPADCQKITSLWAQCNLTRPWNDSEADFHRAVSGASSDILYIEDKGLIIASVMVGEDGHRGWVYYLGVAPENQKTGLGRTLMAAAENWLQQRAAPKIQLMVRSDNHNAAGFYKALGYEVQDVMTIGRRLD